MKKVQLFTVLQWGYSRFQGVSGSYRGVQGVAGGYVWLWFGMVTRGHRLQGVSSGYRGNSALEVVTGVTRGYRGLQRVRGFKRSTGDNRGLQGFTDDYKGL